jgi:aldehyde:ferredoxin oxidoreductase
MYGWAGTILMVDLSKSRIEKIPLSESFAVKWLGGQGFLERLLWEHYDFAERDPFGPKNILGIAPGALTGTLTPGSGRLAVAVALSPALDGYLDANTGGDFACSLKYAGYDAVLITGRARSPVYLRIEDDTVELRDARPYWGRRVRETDRGIKEELEEPRLRTLLIGPAGENRVHSAMITCDRDRAPSAGAMGAVLGSKNLKGVVVHGSRGIQVADPDRHWEVFQAIYNKNKVEPRFARFGEKGTKWLVELSGVLNCQYNAQPKEFPYDKVNVDVFLETFAHGPKACHSCFQHCDHYWHIPSGAYEGEEARGGEAGTIIPLGPMVGNSDMASILHMTHLVNDLGMDSISTGTTLATAMHWWQDGLLTGRHTGGLRLEWGDVEVEQELIRQMAYREGFGAKLADGVFRAAEKVARWNRVPLEQVTRYINANKKKREVGADFRPLKGLAFSKAIDIRECDILNIADTLMAEGPVTKERFEHLGVPESFAEEFGFSYVGNPAVFDDKAKVKVYSDNHCSVCNSLGVCQRYTTWAQMRMGLEDMAECFETATGVKMSWEDLYRAGERIRQLEKAMQLRYGFRKEHDALPDHYYDTPVESGQFEGAYLDKAEFLRELEALYELRGWNRQGFPLKRTLTALELADVAAVLAEEGLLAGAAANKKKTQKKKKKKKAKKKKKTKKKGSGVRGQGSGPAAAPPKEA